MEDVLAALGVTVVMVAGLKDLACWVPTQRVALVRAELDDADREDAYDQLMAYGLGLA